VTLSRLLPIATVAALALGIASCQEDLTAPGDCPGICPSDNLVVADTVLQAVLDSTYTGFVQAGEGVRILVANGGGGEQLLGLARFARRGDSITVRDTAFPFVVDSVILGVTLERRDPAVTGLALEVFKLPETIAVDTSTTYAEVEAALTPERLIRSIPIADDFKSGAVRVVLAGPDLAAVAFTPADTGVLRLAYRLTSPQPTGIMLSSAATGLPGPSFVSWVKVTRPDTTVQQGLPRIVTFDGFVDQTPLGEQPADLISVGGAPSSRALLRFNLPARLRDSAQIIRATLQLVPVGPVTGLPVDSALLDVRGIFSDLGPKSPRISTESLVRNQLLEIGHADSVFIEVTQVARLWNTTSRPPTAFFLAMSPEASTYAFVQFGSSRTPGAIPTLHLTYALPYRFEAQ
jgi:hypothetical protein